MKRLAILSLLALLPAAIPLTAQEGGFQLVVSSANPSSAIAKAQVARLFLKKSTTWDHGLKVVPIDRTANSTVRAAFSRQIHGKEVSFIRNYWQKLIFTGRGTPPPEAGSDREVLDFIRRNSGAIGYVASGTSLGSGIKALRVQG
jgi:ABC-type phosphate transport system substrate-binding protein